MIMSNIANVFLCHPRYKRGRVGENQALHKLYIQMVPGKITRYSLFLFIIGNLYYCSNNNNTVKNEHHKNLINTLVSESFYKKILLN
jgi:hypothetical protein